MGSLLQIVRKINWTLVACIGLLVLLMAPIVKSGFLCDDAGNSLIRGVLAYHRVSMLYLLRYAALDWASSRFTPVAWLEMYGVFYIFTDRFYYKAFIIICLACNLIAFHRLVRKLTDSKPAAVAAVLIVLSLFQFRAFHDPILGFNGLLQTVLMFLLLSYLTLVRFLDTGKKRWLAFSVAAYVLACLSYEISHLMLAVHLAIIIQRRGVSIATLKLLLPYVSVLLICVGVAFYLRATSGVPAKPAYRPNLNPGAMGRTLLKHAVAAMPLSYSIAKPDGHTMLAYAQFGDRVFLSVFAVCAVLSLGVFAGVRRFINQGAGLNLRMLAGCGALLWVLPAVPISLSPRYQREVYWGVGYLPLYVQYFGMACLLLAGGILVLQRLKTRPRWSAAMMTTGALAIAFTLSVTYRSNCAVVHDSARGWLDERVNVESALRAGLLADVPEGAVVLLHDCHPWWHDHFSRYFYMINSGKRFITLAPAQAAGERPWQPTIGLSNPTTVPDQAPCYEVKDFCESAGHGFVFLSKLEDDPQHATAKASGHATRTMRLFVQGGHSGKSHKWFCVTGRRLDSEEPLLLLTSAATPAAETRKGEIYDIPAPVGMLDADSVEAHWSSSPVEVSWTNGFYAAESQQTHSWRWSDTKGTLFLINTSDRNENVKLSLSATALAKSSLQFDSCLFHEELSVGLAESAFEITMQVPPGVHRVTVTSDSTTVHQPNDPRSLGFCLHNLKLTPTE